MKSITLLIVGFFITKHSFCQVDEVDSFYRAKIASLTHEGVDTIIFYSPYLCPMTQYGNDSCIVYEKKFLLWKSKGELFAMTHFYCINFVHPNSTEHYVSKTISTIDSLNVFDFLQTNFDAVVRDTLLYGLIEMECNGSKVYYRPLASHNCYTSIIVFAGGKRFKNGYLDVDLDDGITRNVDGTFRERHESLNYRYNTSRAIYLMITKIESLIEHLEKYKRL